MAPEVMDKLLKSGLKIGLDISARVGPVGKDFEIVDSDFEKFPEVFVYSKNAGLFAGVNFTAENFDGDKKANAIFYGEEVSTKDILFNKAVEMPEEALSFAEYLMSY
jgi:lipid-binding SYLF domain-containing protein